MDSNEVTTTPNNDEVRVVGDFVVVIIRSSLDLAGVEATLCKIDAALRDHGLLQVLVDHRRSPGRTAEADELLHAWLEGCVYHDRVAVLVRDASTSLADDPHVRSFDELEDAVAWLRMGSSPVREAV